MFIHTYQYGAFNRLISATGKAKNASYSMQMTFGRMSEPPAKVQKADSTTTDQSYDFADRYEDSNHPTAPTQIGHGHYTYDVNGNLTPVMNDSFNTSCEMYRDGGRLRHTLSDCQSGIGNRACWMEAQNGSPPARLFPSPVQ